MPVLILQGHNETYAATEMMRLFFGNPVDVSPGRIQAGAPGNSLLSSLAPQGENVRVSTAVCPSDADRTGTTEPQPAFTAVVASGQATREIKRQLYQLLSVLTKRSYPWGSLVGIRPTLVAAECLKQTGDEEQARHLLTDTWFVSPHKADLAIVTARTEEAVLNKIPPGHLLVYVGIPFCPTRCSYCSFITRDAPAHAALLEPYVHAIVTEARTLFQKIRTPVAALYVGGGTPTSLSAGQLDRLLQSVLSCLPLAPDAEITVEAGRPDTIVEDRLHVLRAAGVTRLCINPQTFHDRTLQRIGRCHSTEQTLAACHLAAGMGFDHVNLDLIAGLPGEQPADLDFSLEQALALKPASLTLHALALKRSSALYEADAGTRQSGGSSPLMLPTGAQSLQPAWDDKLQTARKLLAASGLYPYYLYRQKQAIGGLENTGFALAGKACLYNVGMMSDRRGVVGIGSGAVSKKIRGMRVERQANPRELAIYIERVKALTERKISWYTT